MLAHFSVENFKSFLNKQVFEMLRIQKKRMIHDINFPIKTDFISLRKLCLFHGKNGSGKSNLFKAMKYLQFCVLEEDFIFPENICHASSAGKAKKTKFEIYFAVGNRNGEDRDKGNLYRYRLDLNIDGIHLECLEKFSRFSKSKSNYEMIFLRDKNAIKEISPECRDFGNIKLSSFRSFLSFVKGDKREPPVDLALTLHWFSVTLQFISPNDKLKSLQKDLIKDPLFRRNAQELLNGCGTGISEISGSSDRSFNADQLRGMLAVNELHKLLKSETSQMNVIVSSNMKERIVRKTKTEVQDCLISFRHFSLLNMTKTEVDLLDESDGTLRLLDFVPLLHGKENSVYVIDELDRSLHPLVVIKFLGDFCSVRTKNAQLICTLHQADIMDARLDTKFVTKEDVYSVDVRLNGSMLVNHCEYRTKRRNHRDGYLIDMEFGGAPVIYKKEKNIPIVM